MQICKKLLHISNAGAHIYPLMQRENEDKHFTQTTEAKKHGVLKFSFEHSTCLTCSSHFSTFTAVLRRLCGNEILMKQDESMSVYCASCLAQVVMWLQRNKLSSEAVQSYHEVQRAHGIL